MMRICIYKTKRIYHICSFISAMMGAGRLSNGFRSLCRSYSNTLNVHHPWIQVSSRAVSSFSTRPPKFEQKYGNSNTNIITISRRFLHLSKNEKKGTGFFASFKSKLLATIGAALGLGIGSGVIIRNPGSNNKNEFEDDHFLVYCQEEENTKEGEIGEDECDERSQCVPKRCHSTDHFHILDCEEDMIRKANFDFERAVMNIRGKVVKYTEDAMDASCEAICLMQKYLDCAYCVIDNDELTPENPLYEKSWCCLYEIAKARCEAVQTALSKQMCAWELLCKLREVIEEAKVCKYTSCNPLIQPAEDAFQCAEQGLLDMKKRMDTIQSDSEAVEQYLEVIQKFKKDLRDEIDKLPESQKCELQSYEQETVLIINQAYSRVVRLQKEQALLQVCTGGVPENLKSTTC